MAIIMVDSCVVLDLAKPENEWFEWSASLLEDLDETNTFVINPVIYAECAIGYDRIEEVEAFFDTLGFKMPNLPRESLFLAGKAYLQYRQNKGTRQSVLPDFFIGAHAAVSGYALITRDRGRFSTYFPSVELITPFTS